MHILKTTAYSLLALSGATVAGLVFFTHRTARKVRAALPPSGSFVDLPHGRLHVREQGTGPVLLLVHGLGGQMGQFNYDVVERLAADFRVVVVDRPGSGYSAPLASPDLVSQADALAELIARLELGRPLVVGHSLGGAVALALALHHPERVAGLALIAPLAALPETVPAHVSAATDSLALAAPAGGLDGGHAAVHPPQPPGDAGPVPPRNSAPRLRHPGRRHAQPPARPVPGHHRRPRILARYLPTLTARFPELRLPVRVLYGRQDAVLDAEFNGRALTDNIPGATLQLIDGGHMLPITQSERVADSSAKPRSGE